MISSPEGVGVILAAVHSREPLSVTNTDFNDFNDELGITLKMNESYLNYEARFAAQVSKYQSHGTTLQLHQSILAMILFSGSNIDYTPRVPIISAAGADLAIQLDDNEDIIFT